MAHYNGTTQSFRGFSLVIRSFSDAWLVNASTDVITFVRLSNAYRYRATYHYLGVGRIASGRMPSEHLEYDCM